jgi:CAAX prenyl protease-like protein
MPTEIENQAKPSNRRGIRIGDDTAYMLPMAAFLILLAIGGHWKSLYPAAYAARETTAAILLIALRKHYTKIRWDYWWLGIIVGVIGIFQWVGMQKLLQHWKHFQPGPDVFNPMEHFHNHAAMWTFIVLRIAGAAIVVPFMEELFWRDYLWRTIIAPNDFKLARIGEWDWKAVVIVCAAFASVHGNWWLTAVVWGLMIAALLLYTKSIGACIIAHATTNLLLGLYVLKWNEWSFW